MREAMDAATDERRDVLAHDWARFLRAVVPRVAWCPIPNIGDTAVEYLVQWELDAICLTGGDDIGDRSARDVTELALLAHCFANAVPVLGICRGLQRIWTELGGRLIPIDGHAGTTHTVMLNAADAGLSCTVEANSYHRFGLDGSKVPQLLTCIGRAPDGSIEAVLGAAPRVLGLMWHPERMAVAHPADVRLIRWFLRYD